MKDNLPIKDQKVLLVLTELETRLQDLLGERLVKIILYGSYARNEQNADSDMNIMVLVHQGKEDLDRYNLAVVGISTEMGRKFDIILKVIIKDFFQFQYYAELLPFYMNVKTEGLEIFGRTSMLQD